MAALRADGPVVIDNAAAIATSFPEFTARARAAGLGVVA
jgi:5-enolpyruvylshikimate-3-phosphate synthase